MSKALKGESTKVHWAITPKMSLFEHKVPKRNDLNIVVRRFLIEEDYKTFNIHYASDVKVWNRD